MATYVLEIVTPNADVHRFSIAASTQHTAAAIAYQMLFASNPKLAKYRTARGLVLTHLYSA